MVSKHDYSKAADVYSFGIILWEMMTWRLPWDDLNPFQVMCSTRVGQTSFSMNRLCTEAWLSFMVSYDILYAHLCKAGF